MTAGPTHEPIDPVRFVGNRSSGQDGRRRRREALAAGRAVTLVLGPGTVEPPAGGRGRGRDRRGDARAPSLDAAADADVIVMAAAVADFRPKRSADRKLKKDDGVPELLLEPTPDILPSWVSARRPGSPRGVRGGDPRRRGAGRDKLGARASTCSSPTRWAGTGTGFGSDTNEAAILAADGEDVALRGGRSASSPAAICDRIAELLATGASARPAPSGAAARLARMSRATSSRPNP